MYIKKISYIGIALAYLINSNSNAMVSRVYQRGQQIGARAAAIPGRMSQNMYNYWARLKGYMGVTKPGSVPEQIMTHAKYPIVYERGVPRSPITMVEQIKRADPLLKTEKMLTPFGITVASLGMLTSTAILTSGDADLIEKVMGGILGGFSIASLAFLFKQVLPYESNPFLAARSIFKQAIRKGFLTDEQRLSLALANLISGGTSNLDPSEFPADIINEPLLNGQTLLQQLLAKTKEKNDSSILIAFAISYGADPQQHTPSTLHPIDMVLNAKHHSDKSLTLLALLNPYITRYREPIPADIATRVIQYVNQKKVGVLAEIDKSKNEHGSFVLNNSKKEDLANELLSLNQIEEELVLRGNIPASQVKSPFSEE